MKLFLIGISFFVQSVFAYDALVWGGPGACSDGCIDAAVYVSRLAGLDPIIVTPENFDPSLFESAKVWVQPGGKSSTASKAMGETIRSAIVAFVQNGGGYVGFCAGAFLTTSKVGSTENPGLGIIKGKTKLFENANSNATVEAMNTPNGIKYHYWEGGPYFTLDSLKNVTVKSSYRSTNQINAVETTFGKGRISVSGTHPEAPQDWYDYFKLNDRDGLDNEEAAAMIKWAARN